MECLNLDGWERCCLAVDGDAVAAVSSLVASSVGVVVNVVSVAVGVVKVVANVASVVVGDFAQQTAVAWAPSVELASSGVAFATGVGLES